MYDTLKPPGATLRTKGSPVYPSVARVVRKLGSDLSLARRARRIPADDFARSMGVSRTTLHRLEKGDAGVSINTLAMALHALGRLDLLADLIDGTKDDAALMAMRGEVPARVRRAKLLNRAEAARAGQRSGEATSAGEGPVVGKDGVTGW